MHVCTSPKRASDTAAPDKHIFWIMHSNVEQMKTLATRAGPGTKVVCLGNIAQIDTPYLTEASSGLTYVVERFKGWKHGGHLTLQRGERSRLADFAADVL